MNLPTAVFKSIANRGKPSPSFITEIVEWGKTASEDIFAPNKNADIYGKIVDELGPWKSPLHRRAAMLCVITVLAGFESSWDWREGVDTSRLGADTPDNAEAGLCQVSYDVRRKAPELSAWLLARGITDGVKFQQVMKFDHPAALEFIARVLRVTTLHNGPLYKGDERRAIRLSLRGPEHSIYPWLSRATCSAFETLLQG